MNTPTLINSYKREITHKDKSYEVIIKSYAEPIRKSENVKCYTRIAIMDGQFEWGHTLLPNQVTDTDYEKVFKFIEDEFEKFKNA